MNIETLKAPNSLTVRHISDYADQIRASLAAADAIALDLSDSEDLDLSVLQLITAARAKADAAGKSVTLVAPAQGALLQLLNRAGFASELTAADTDFWFHGERPQ